MEYALLEDLPLEIKSREARYTKNSFRWILFNVRGEKGGVRDECATPHITKKNNISDDEQRNRRFFSFVYFFQRHFNFLRLCYNPISLCSNTSQIVFVDNLLRQSNRIWEELKIAQNFFFWCMIFVLPIIVEYY